MAKKRGRHQKCVGSPDLLTSSGGAAIVAHRDRSLELLARELVGIEAWHHGAPPVEIGDPEPLWQIARQAYHEW